VSVLLDLYWQLDVDRDVHRRTGVVSTVCTDGTVLATPMGKWLWSDGRGMQHVRRTEINRGFWKGNLKKRPLGDLEETGWKAGDWINLARNRDRWWAVVNTVTNTRGPIKCEEVLTGGKLLACQ